MALKPLPTDQSAYVGTDGKPAIVFYTWLKSLADTLNTFFVGGGTTSFAWTDLPGVTVTTDGGALGAYTVTCRFVQIGKIVFLWFNINVSAIGAGSGPATITFPSTLPLPLQADNCIPGYEDIGNNLVQAKLFNDRTMRLRRYDGAAVLFSGALVICNGTYEAA